MDSSSSDEDAEKRESLMQEAIKILKQEGFNLPGDVVDTLKDVSRSNAAARRKGSLRGHRMSEVQSQSKKIRNVRESSGRRGQDRSAERPTPENTTSSESKSTSTASTVRERRMDVPRQDSDEVFMPPAENADDTAKNNVTETRKIERSESSESGSTCSASTVKERKDSSDGHSVHRPDFGSEGATGLSKFRRSHLESGSDTGYNTSIENVIQSREAKSENLRNMNKATCGDYTQNGLKREISCDSGFTECSQNALMENSPSDSQGLTTQDFNTVSISNSDVSERYAASGSGEAHTVISSASDLNAANMTVKGDSVTQDGTVVSSNAKLENQESNSTLLRVTNKTTDEEISKEDDYESVNRTTKSSRNDSVSTSATGETTTASRHAASIEQGLYKERSKLTESTDGSVVAADMSVDQQLARNQEMNCIEQSDDGSTKVENKKLTEKNVTSKSHREQNIDSADGNISQHISSSQNIDSSSKMSETEETITKDTGEVIKRRNDSSSTAMNESTSSEQKTVKQNPYTGGTNTEIVKKSETNVSSTESKIKSERNETDSGVTESKHEEDSKSMSSSFKGECEAEDVVNGLKLRRVTSTEKSSESSVSSKRSVSSHSSIGGPKEKAGRAAGRRVSEDDDTASNYSGVSGLSKDDIDPPTYEETMSNLSRHDSHGSLSSLYSRQDSSASSIASSASAFNERQRQKALEKERRNNSDEKEKRRLREDHSYPHRPKDTARQDSFSSDSTVTEGSLYRGREIVHPIRKVETNVYGRSLTDTVIGQPANRRATLLGDVVLTERERRQVREDVDTRRMGRDDSYLDRRGIQNKYRGDRKKDFDVFGNKSFKDEVMSMVDKFFEDDDDDLHFGTHSRHREEANISSDLDFRRGRDNPYTPREDLSKYSESVNFTSSNVTPVGYAASDSGFPVHSSRQYNRSSNKFDSDFSDIASESGHNRFSRRSDRQNQSSHHYENIPRNSASRNIANNDYQFSHLSNAYSSSQENGLIQKAGKSIGRDRNITRSISDHRENKHYSNGISGDTKRYVEGHDRSYLGRCHPGEYKSFDMSDVDSACNSVTSLPNDIYGRRNRLAAEHLRTHSLPDIADTDSSRDYIHDPAYDEDKEQWNERRRRIDKALSWIQSELSGLRTQDKILMSQFQRCQDSIEELKKQRPWYEVFSDEEDEDEDGKHWEDWEIDDFDRRDSRDRSRGMSRAGPESSRTRGILSRVFKSSRE